MCPQALSSLPSVDRLLSTDIAARLADQFGRVRVKETLRSVLDDVRVKVTQGDAAATIDADTILALAGDALAQTDEPSLRPVFNFTGTVLHTNLGRALLPQAAIDRIAAVAAGASNLEFDLDAGQRGDRDDHIESLLQEITGAEAATIVNNNAAAVLLTLNTFAEGKEVLVSRGELVEIGGSFRIPEIMRRAGARLREVGATNRTHEKDFIEAIDETTGLVMKVHTSNYEIHGFTKAVEETALAALSRNAGIPFANDLGSGTLIDLTRYGLPYEPTVQRALEQGADLVTFSGDKLLGGPQAGMIVGKREFIDRIKANPMKRALRVDKLTLAAMFEVLKLYRDPDTLAERLPTLKLLTRPAADIEAMAKAVAPALTETLGQFASIEIEACNGQIGSGAMPTEILPGFCLVITPKKRTEKALQQLAVAFRALPVPVIGRVNDGRLYFDLRTLDVPEAFTEQLSQLNLS